MSSKIYADVGSDQAVRKWGRIRDAVRCTGLSRTHLYQIIAAGQIESFVFKRHPAAVSGCRMINLDSLTAFLDAEAAKAKGESL